MLDVPTFGRFLLETAPKVSSNFSTYKSRSPLDKVLLNASLTKFKGSFLFRTSTDIPDCLFSSRDSSFYLYLSSSF
jgi:hypothetical protein